MVFKSNKESRKESLRARWDCIYTPKGCYWWHPNQCGSPCPLVCVFSNAWNMEPKWVGWWVVV